MAAGTNAHQGAGWRGRQSSGESWAAKNGGEVPPVGPTRRDVIEEGALFSVTKRGKEKGGLRRTFGSAERGGSRELSKLYRKKKCVEQSLEDKKHSLDGAGRRTVGIGKKRPTVKGISVLRRG